MDQIIARLYENIPTSIIALITAFIAVKWSISKFYAEKGWERKEKAYEEIINCLYDLLQYCEIEKNDFGDGAGYSDQKIRELGEKYSKAFWNIKRATAIGEFIVSVDALKVLEKLKERPILNWDENAPFDVFDHEYQYYKDALKQIIEVAKNDLRLK